MTAPGKDKFDYSSFDASRRSFGYRLTWRDYFRLHQISRRVASGHGISDPRSQEAHLHLVFELWDHLGTQSRTYLKNGSIKIAADAPDLKSVTEEILPDLNKHLGKVVELLHQTEGNEVFLTLILDAAGEGDSPGDQMWSMFQFAETVARAANFKGAAGKKRNPDWVKAFCVSCQRFWYYHGSGGTRLNFKAQWQPAICGWVKQLFKELRDYRSDVDPTFKRPRAAVDQALETAAKNLPAYRPPKGGENGV